MVLVETDLTDRIRCEWVQMLDVGAWRRSFQGALGTLRPRTETRPRMEDFPLVWVQVSGRRSVGGAHSSGLCTHCGPRMASPCWSP